MPQAKFTRRLRLTAAMALLAVGSHALALDPSSYVELLPEPMPADGSIDWFDGKDHQLESLAMSLWNFDRYYGEARARYGRMPSDPELLLADAGWFLYLSTILGVDKLTANPPDHGWFWTYTQPEIPLANREVTPVNYKTGFRKPHLPPNRWTRDGRIGVNSDTAGADGEPAPLRIQLNRPEVLGRHFMDSAPGLPTVDPQEWVVSDYKAWGMPGSSMAQMVTICDAQPVTAADANPHTGGTSGEDDVYELTLIGTAIKLTINTSVQNREPGGIRTMLLPQLESEDRLFSRKVTVRVENPKTAAARIAEVTFSPEYKSAPIRQGALFEPLTPADGRLFVARRGGLPLVWRHTQTGQMRAGNYETVYAVAPPDAEPCDVTQWGDLYPLSHAPFDPRVKDKYLFAKYPFRDPMGNYIPDGADMKGTYPWIDKDAKVISLMISGAHMFGGNYIIPQARYNHRCVHEGCRPDDIDHSNDLIYAMIGGWTKGKAVVIDNMLNYGDFRFNLSNALYLDLYQPGSALSSTENTASSVELGATRSNSVADRNSNVPLYDAYGNPVLGRDGTPQYHFLKNSSVFDTIDNRLNYNPNMKPVSPHDVVWTVSSGAVTDDLSFDDMLNNNAFIVSDMATAFTAANDNLFRMTAYDGWNQLWGDWRGQVKMQNAATTLPDTWVVPSAGNVENGRAEPVANGGVKGKGLYFNGINTRLGYDISGSQPQSMGASYWFHSLFIEARGLTSTEERIVLDFPDKSRLTMRDAGLNVSFQAYNNYGELKQVFMVPASLVRERWLQLGIQTAPSNLITIFINGFPYTEFTSTEGSMFRMTGGALALGTNQNSYDKRYEGFWNWLFGISTATQTSYAAFRGWMDEYKVFAYKPDPETACNLAYGTLVATGTNMAMAGQAALYPAAMHARISTALQLRGQPTHAQYACFQDDPSRDRLSKLNHIPDGAISLRQGMHFPEGPLYHDAPRPDSTSNEFCLACHSTGGAGGLTVEALKYTAGLPAKYDPRRQPTQAPPFITGNIPSAFVASFGGNWSAIGSSYIDEYIQPSSAGVAPDIRNLVQVVGGRPVSVVNSGATVSRSSASALRINASGLTGRAEFRVNGTLVLDDRAAPFEMPTGSLASGTNQVSITTYSSNGMQSQRSYSITVQ